jgi:hypothetical protein
MVTFGTPLPNSSVIFPVTVSEFWAMDCNEPIKNMKQRSNAIVAGRTFFFI